jgi:hypothetical protein
MCKRLKLHHWEQKKYLENNHGVVANFSSSPEDHPFYEEAYVRDEVGQKLSPWSLLESAY